MPYLTLPIHKIPFSHFVTFPSNTKVNSYFYCQKVNCHREIHWNYSYQLPWEMKLFMTVKIWALRPGMTRNQYRQKPLPVKTAIPFQLYVCPAVLLRKPIHDSKPESPAATACKIWSDFYCMNFPPCICFLLRNMNSGAISLGGKYALKHSSIRSQFPCHSAVLIFQSLVP